MSLEGQELSVLPNHCPKNEEQQHLLLLEIEIINLPVFTAL